MGLGSQRQGMESSLFHESWRAARRAAPTVPMFANLGAPEVAKNPPLKELLRLIEMIEADGFAVHLNPLQELMQPEGEPNFRGVLAGIERLARELPVPVIVKEVGAGLSADVVRRLIEAGVRYIDISGAGGTSWSGVELLRSPDGEIDDPFWDWGIPTADAIIEARPLCDEHQVTMIGSGGIATSGDMAIALALGAHVVASARPILKTLVNRGQNALVDLLRLWERHLRYTMFLTGSPNIATFRNAPLRRKGSAEDFSTTP